MEAGRLEIINGGVFEKQTQTLRRDQTLAPDIALKPDRAAFHRARGNQDVERTTTDAEELGCLSRGKPLDGGRGDDWWGWMNFHTP